MRAFCYSIRDMNYGQMCFREFSLIRGRYTPFIDYTVIRRVAK